MVVGSPSQKLIRFRTGPPSALLLPPALLLLLPAVATTPSMGWEGGGAPDMDTFSCFVLGCCCCCSPSSSSSSLPSAVRMLRMLEEQEDAESRLPPRHEP